MPPTPHAFMTGMGTRGPWMCFNRMKGLTATNTLYTIRFHGSITEIQRYGLALSLLSSPAQRQIRRIGRSYADGLVKYEPGALLKLELPSFTVSPNLKTLYGKAVKALLKGDRIASRHLADSALINSQHTLSPQYRRTA
jgi:hypothetical protein